MKNHPLENTELDRYDKVGLHLNVILVNIGVSTYGNLCTASSQQWSHLKHSRRGVGSEIFFFIKINIRFSF